MLWGMNSIIFIWRLTCTVWIPCLRAYGSELGWFMGFELILIFGMVMRAYVGSPLGYSINMLLGLALGNSFDAQEWYLFWVSLDTLVGLMIDNGEGFVVGLSL